jgi:hypothetical protein
MRTFFDPQLQALARIAERRRMFMGDLLIDNQGVPLTPAAGKSILYIDSTGKRHVTLDDTGAARGLLAKNAAIASQGPGFAVDTWVTGSDLIVPSSGLQAGLLFRWVITASKTAAGLASPVIAIRLGAARSVADLAIQAFVTAAQTAVADNGTLFITSLLRNVGAAAIMAGCAAWAKTQTGLVGFGGSIDNVGGAFDSTGRAGQFVSLSINGGAAAAWTLTSVSAEMIG